jgi:hypothetical protein
MPETVLPIPQIDGPDIDWVQDLMRLDDLDEPRREFLRSATTLDVAACPGSGKTTLIVAKLAILARKWTHKTRGICILSHTNAAREEIGHRLGRTVVGQRLLAYPHFIDTIHGFANRFLALPWLAANGFPAPTIDDDVTAAVRRGALSESEFWKVKKLLESHYKSFEGLRIRDRDLTFDYPTGSHTPTFALAKRAIEAAAGAGYFCHEEMFVWARALLADQPAVASWLRRRFPLVLIDEMQDTSAVQGDLLESLFSRSAPDIVVQRVGDPNQAIFNSSEEELAAVTAFPDPSRCLAIPHSYRFGSDIAALASPFAVAPVGSSGLCGRGPKNALPVEAHCAHAVFVFPDGSTAGVLDAYGRHVLATFSDGVLSDGAGRVTAVGAVHEDASDVVPGHAHFPKSVAHYWANYSAVQARREPHPRTLVEYFRIARAAAHDARELSPGVERAASGLIRLAGRVGDLRRLKRRHRNHRALVDALQASPATLDRYRALLRQLLVAGVELCKEDWQATREAALEVAMALSEAQDSTVVGSFLAWNEDTPSGASGTAPSGARGLRSNSYRVAEQGRVVDIQLGSIHSVKGQTHLATMVLETYWHKHLFGRLLPWLRGSKSNGVGVGVQDRKRLLQTYVAMTRPSHLLCLAIPRSRFGDDATFAADRATLIGRGWRVAEIVGGMSQWLD